jgi:hypothetical protein
VARGRVNGMLAVSRAIGDHDYKTRSVPHPRLHMVRLITTPDTKHATSFCVTRQVSIESTVLRVRVRPLVLFYVSLRPNVIAC